MSSAADRGFLIRLHSELILSGVNHNTLKKLIVIEGEAINETPIRVGKGRDELGEVDLPVVRRSDGVPIIPASSLKGSMRSLAESLARSSGYWVCDTFSTIYDCSFRSCLASYAADEISRAIIVGSSDLGDVVEVIRDKAHECARSFIKDQETMSSLKRLLDGIRSLEDIDPEKKREVFERLFRPCIVCRIFGNQSLASHLRVFDIEPLDGDIITMVRPRVAIDRFRRASRHGALFEYEYIPPGYRWKFKLEAKNLDGEELKLFKRVLEAFVNGFIGIGGMRSVGHGILKLDSRKTKVLEYLVENLELKKKELSLEEFLAG